MAKAVVTTWYGTFLLDGARVVRSELAPRTEPELAERSALRRGGRLTPEEARMLELRGTEEWLTRDRRLVAEGLRWDPEAPALAPVAERSDDRDLHRRVMLEGAERDLRAAWDPSVHVEEAVRAAADLDRVRNLIGERLGSWVSRDRPEIDPGDHSAAARAAVADAPLTELAPADPALRSARRALAELYRAVESAHLDLTKAVESAVPPKTPNVTALLGPELTARLLAQARGLERLARLPSSTIQVLGAERAFFEHLRGRAPPPRHGLLFLHPAIQSAPRRDRGRLARSLAGKVAIAARLDRAGRPVDPSLARSFEARRAALEAARRKGGPGARARRLR
jgi:nucleolar protein 56